MLVGGCLYNVLLPMKPMTLFRNKRVSHISSFREPRQNLVDILKVEEQVLDTPRPIIAKRNSQQRILWKIRNHSIVYTIKTDHKTLFRTSHYVLRPTLGEWVWRKLTQIRMERWIMIQQSVTWLQTRPKRDITQISIFRQVDRLLYCSTGS